MQIFLFSWDFTQLIFFFPGPVRDYFEGLYPMRDLPGISPPFTGFLGSPGPLKPRPGEPLQSVLDVGNIYPMVEMWTEGGEQVFQPILASGGMSSASDKYPWTSDGAAGRSPTEMYLRECVKIASSFSGRGSLAFEPFLRDTPEDHLFLRKMRSAMRYAPIGLAKHIESLLSAIDRYLRNVG